jgi:hypothetical protein
VLPWSTAWDKNYFAYAWPALRSFLTNDFVRGGVSGLGFVNLFAGLAELAPVFLQGSSNPRLEDRTDG